METIKIAYFAFGGIVKWIQKIQRTIAQFKQPLASALGQTIQTQIHFARQCIVRTFVQALF